VELKNKISDAAYKQKMSLLRYICGIRTGKIAITADAFRLTQVTQSHYISPIIYHII